MKKKQIGAFLAIAAGVGTAVGASSQNIAAGFAVGIAFFMAFNAARTFKKE